MNYRVRPRAVTRPVNSSINDSTPRLIREFKIRSVAKRTAPLQTLLSALEQPGSCFILGAGVSAPIVPLAGQLGDLVRKRLLATGSFPASPIPRDVISDRILGPI